jgi:predicted metal-binding membrane protein
MPAAVEATLARHRAVSIASLLLLVLVAWAWLLTGAGMDMVPLFSLKPAAPEPHDMAGMAMPMDMPMPMPSDWSASYFAIIFAMWWLMMVAMMLPSAAPTILLYLRVAGKTAIEVRPAAGAFLAGYLIAWGGFSLLATLLQFLLERLELVAPDVLASQSRPFSGAILAAAGLYQLSPLKNACLRHCRSPAQFLASHFRAGRSGALRMGAVHGVYCIGCCWLLMALLFVGGIMNLAWIAVLTVMVAAEKLLPHGRLVSIVAGSACVLWGGVLLLG